MENSYSKDLLWRNSREEGKVLKFDRELMWRNVWDKKKLDGLEKIPN